MFESISSNLTQLAAFSVLGFFLALFYEPLRIIRLFRRQGVWSVGIQDFLFLTFAGIISFAYSVELGAGSFRFFYFISELFGAVLYFVTIGKLISMISDLIVKSIKWLLHFIKIKIMLPLLHIFYKIYKFFINKLKRFCQFIVKRSKIVLLGLKSRAGIVYNNRVQRKQIKIAENIKSKSGETKNVIKAKIRVSVQKKA